MKGKAKFEAMQQNRNQAKKMKHSIFLTRIFTHICVPTKVSFLFAERNPRVGLSYLMIQALLRGNVELETSMSGPLTIEEIQIWETRQGQ